MKTTSIFFRILACLLVICSNLAVGEAEVPPPVRVMPIGDSITQGCCSGTSTVGGYRNQLYSLLSSDGFNVDFVGTQSDPSNPHVPAPRHEGHGGSRIEYLRQNIEFWLKKTNDPDVILLHIGTNDFSAGAGLGVTQGRLRELIAEIAVLRPYAKIIVASLIPRTDESHLAAIQNEFNLPLPGIVNEQVERGRQVSMVNMHTALLPEELADGIHPTLAGYDKMADRWVHAIREVITPLGTSNPPEIAQIDARTSLDRVTVKFSKPVKHEDVVPSNFVLSGGVSVLHAELDTDSKRTVTLTTSLQVPGTLYDLSVQGIHDRTTLEHAVPAGMVRSFTSRTIIDGSFESSGVQWVGGGNVSITESNGVQASDGQKLAVFNAGHTEPNGIISQEFPTVIGQQYHLRFDVGTYSFNTTMQGLRVTVTSEDGSALLSPLISTLSGLGGGSIGWKTLAVPFRANSQTTSVTFEDISPVTADIDLLLDDVQVSAVVTRTLAVACLPDTAVEIAVSPPDLDGNNGGLVEFSMSYEDSTVVTVTAPDTIHDGKAFQEWRMGGIHYSSDGVTAVTMTEDQSLTAVYVENAPPVAVDDSYSGLVETPITIAAPGVLANDTDHLAETVVAKLESQPAHGSVILALDGGFTYTPVAGYVGPDSFSYYANDGDLDSNVATVSLTINPAPPGIPVNGGFELGNPSNFGSLYGWTTSGTQFGYLADTSYTATEGGRLVVFGGGSDANDGMISQTFPTTPGQLYALEFDMGIFGTTGPKQRLEVTVVGTSNTLVSRLEEISAVAPQNQWASHWDPDGKGYSFVADGSEATVTFSDASESLPLNQRTFTDLLLDNVRVTEVLASTLTVNSSPFSGVNIMISHPDLDGLGGGGTEFSRSYGNKTVLSLTAPAISGGSFFKTWQVNGADVVPADLSTTLKISGDHIYTAVYEIKPPPVARPDSYFIVEGLQLKVPTPGVLGNDGDSNTPDLSATIDSPPIHGGVIVLADGSFIYTPPAGFVGEDSFTYRANNGVDDSAPATVTITVNPPGPFVNGSFEFGAPFMEPEDWKFRLDGWIIDGNSFGYEAEPVNYVPLEGNGSRMAVFNGGDDDFSGSITQRFTTTVGQEYELEFDLGISGIAGNRQRLRITIADGAPIEEEIVASGGHTLWADPAKKYRFVAESDATTLKFSDASASLPLDQTKWTDLLLDNVRITAVAPDEFKLWMEGFGLFDGPEQDSDGDSISNALEYVFGGNPTAPGDVDLLPTVTLVSEDPNGNSQPGEYLLFTYRLTNLAKGDPLTTIRTEWTTDLLGPWTVAEETQGIVFDVVENGYGPGISLVHVYLPRSLEVNERLFVRLSVTIATP